MVEKIFIIILNYNCWQDTIECLESVFKNEYPDFNVVVVDNNSPDNSMDYIKAWADGKLNVWIPPENPLRYLSFPPVKKPIFYNYFNLKKDKFPERIKFGKFTLIQTGENRGFAAGNNAVIKLLLEKQEMGFVFLLNPDVIVDKNTFKELVRCAVSKDEVYGVSMYDYNIPSNLLFLGGAEIQPFGTIKFVKTLDQVNNLDYISGAAFFTHIENFAKNGLLPEEYFLYWEETDWCTKAKMSGMKMKVCKNAKCYNKGGKSVGRGSYLSEYYYTLNSLKFHKKYFPERVKLIEFFSILRMVKRLFYGKFALYKAIIKAIKDFKSMKGTEVEYYR